LPWKQKGEAVNSLELKAFVDRIENDQAFLLLGDSGDTAVWPRKLLPKEAAEGSVLRVTIRLDENATRQTENIVDTLIERLQRGG
jgi:uncharacterized protein